MSGSEFGAGFMPAGGREDVGVGTAAREGSLPQGRTRGEFGARDLETPHRAQSVVGDDVPPGGSNVNGGVTRRQRRSVQGLARAKIGVPAPKNYRTTTAVMFNNFDEMVQDTISREFAQEIIEGLFAAWGVPVEQAETAKYAEDMLWTFLIAVTASNKADYNKVFDIPVKGSSGVVVADFATLSRLLESVHGVTRRQFARAVADDLKGFLKNEENTFMLPQLATRVGCEPMLAYLAFDGSTHCTGMTSREVAFTKTLESRNLFERDDVVAQGSSDRLMAGMSGGVRSVSVR